MAKYYNVPPPCSCIQNDAKAHIGGVSS